MVSFDIKSLYTSVPVRETIDICLDKLFVEENTTVEGLNKSDFKKLLEFSLLDSIFIFDGKLYKQTDGLAMGNPIAPTVANIFMSQLEEKYLHEYSPIFLPLLYHRCLDNTCVFSKIKIKPMPS